MNCMLYSWLAVYQNERFRLCEELTGEPLAFPIEGNDDLHDVAQISLVVFFDFSVKIDTHDKEWWTQRVHSSSSEQLKYKKTIQSLVKSASRISSNMLHKHCRKALGKHCDDDFFIYLTSINVPQIMTIQNSSVTNLLDMINYNLIVYTQ